jgi:transcriptional regulator with XRE-family HTH domain
MPLRVIRKFDGDFMFGKFIKKRRIELKITLRQFVMDLKLDPCNWSRIEAERIAPPQEIEILFAISNYLDVDLEILQDMAHKDREIVFVPYDDAELVKHLPILLPREWSEEKLLEFAEWMRERI